MGAFFTMECDSCKKDPAAKKTMAMDWDILFVDLVSGFNQVPQMFLILIVTIYLT